MNPPVHTAYRRKNSYYPHHKAIRKESHEINRQHSDRKIKAIKEKQMLHSFIRHSADQGCRPTSSADPSYTYVKCQWVRIIITGILGYFVIIRSYSFMIVLYYIQKNGLLRYVQSACQEEKPVNLANVIFKLTVGCK